MTTYAIDPVRLRENQVRLGLWMFLSTATMLFAAFASAYVVRRSGSDWRPIALPPVLWINTAVLAASSLALEAASTLGGRRRWSAALAAFAAALACGLGFLAGQVAAWRTLVASGIELPSGPHGAFFFVLTGAHGVHIVAALVVLAWGFTRTWARPVDVRAWAVQMELCRTFWHFLGVVWLLLFALVMR
jgi:cytochrome c oxidase subunit 3